jgi:hypothetical protein
MQRRRKDGAASRHESPERVTCKYESSNSSGTVRFSSKQNLNPIKFGNRMAATPDILSPIV